MYMQQSFVEIFTGIFLSGSFVASSLTLLCYRLLVASPNRMVFGGWKGYSFFYLVIAMTAPCAYPFEDVSYLRGLLLYLLFSVPLLVSGVVDIVRNVPRCGVLLSFVVETAMFPIWFYAMFNVLMDFDFV